MKKIKKLDPAYRKDGLVFGYKVQVIWIDDDNSFTLVFPDIKDENGDTLVANTTEIFSIVIFDSLFDTKFDKLEDVPQDLHDKMEFLLSADAFEQ